MHIKHFFILILVLAMAACSTTRKGGYYLDDGPDSRPQDVSQVKEPTPRAEPLSKSGNKPYVVFGKTYRPLKTAAGYSRKGISSWYGKKFHGRKTSSGEKYDMYKMSAAHKTLPLPSFVQVRNLDNNRSVIVRVNDRGPFLHNRLIDLSYAAAHRLDIIRTGTGRVEVKAITSHSENSGQSKPQQSLGGEKAYLQVGSFSSHENARNLQSKLQASIDQSVFIQNASVNNTTIYRVRIGPIASPAESQALAQTLRDSHNLTDSHLIFE
jgi:rare lipoprotein A